MCGRDSDQEQRPDASVLLAHPFLKKNYGKKEEGGTGTV
jgi:hypothetical protein